MGFFSDWGDRLNNAFNIVHIARKIEARRQSAGSSYSDEDEEYDDDSPCRADWSPEKRRKVRAMEEEEEEEERRRRDDDDEDDGYIYFKR